MGENEWLSFNEFVKRVTGTITGSGVRALIQKEKENGASYFVRRIGAKILLSPKKFYEWIDKEGKV